MHSIGAMHRGKYGVNQNRQRERLQYLQKHRQHKQRQLHRDQRHVFAEIRKRSQKITHLELRGRDESGNYAALDHRGLIDNLGRFLRLRFLFLLLRQHP